MKFFIPGFFLLISFFLFGNCVNNGLGRVPQMAWNSWATFACSINETLIKEIITQFSKLNLKSYGYEYVNMDDCWAGFRQNGTIHPDPKSFPNGIKVLADYAHSLGLKFGLYTDEGTNTCAGRPGSLGFEKNDADTYASWGIDYVKVDNCNDKNISPKIRYPRMRDALNSTDRRMFFSMCEWGSHNPALWAPEVGNSWRTTTDLAPCWTSMMTNIDLNNLWANYAGPGGWNDPDILQIGVGNQLSYDEQVTHFSLWCIAKAPLLIGADIRSMTNQTFGIYTNTEAIKVNQDPLGIQGSKKSTYFVNPISKDAFKVTAGSCLQSDPNCLQHWYINETTIYSTQHLSYSNTGKTFCLQLFEQGNATNAQVSACNSDSADQKWIISGDLIQSMYNKELCLTSMENGNVGVSKCNRGDSKQTWKVSGGTIKTVDSKCLSYSHGADLEVWAGPLSNNAHSVVLLNRILNPSNITAVFSDIGLKSGISYKVRDIWQHKDLGNHMNSFTTKVNPHASVMLTLTPN